MFDKIIFQKFDKNFIIYNIFYFQKSSITIKFFLIVIHRFVLYIYILSVLYIVFYYTYIVSYHSALNYIFPDIYIFKYAFFFLYFCQKYEVRILKNVRMQICILYMSFFFYYASSVLYFCWMSHILYFY